MKMIVSCMLLFLLTVSSAYAQQAMQNMWSADGQNRGSVGRNGMIYGPDGRFVGQIQRNGTAPRVTEGGFGRGTAEGAANARRQADRAQAVYGGSGQYLGQKDRRGQFYDAQGIYRGQLR